MRRYTDKELTGKRTFQENEKLSYPKLLQHAGETLVDKKKKRWTEEMRPEQASWGLIADDDSLCPDLSLGVVHNFSPTQSFNYYH